MKGTKGYAQRDIYMRIDITVRITLGKKIAKEKESCILVNLS